MGEFTRVKDFAEDIRRRPETVYRLIREGVLEGVAGGRITTASGDAYKASLRTKARPQDNVLKAQQVAHAARKARSASAA